SPCCVGCGVIITCARSTRGPTPWASSSWPWRSKPKTRPCATRRMRLWAGPCFFHIPPHYVVERFTCSSKATRGEDLQVEHPSWCRYVSTFYFHSTLTGMLGTTLIRDQVV